MKVYRRYVDTFNFNWYNGVHGESQPPATQHMQENGQQLMLLYKMHLPIKKVGDCSASAADVPQDRRHAPSNFMPIVHSESWRTNSNLTCIRYPQLPTRFKKRKPGQTQKSKFHTFLTTRKPFLFDVKKQEKVSRWLHWELCTHKA